jgi:hemoglobin
VPSFYEDVGGEPVFRKIVARFYAEVAVDEILRAVYPEVDLGPAEERLRMYLIQHWGGPKTYALHRGNPKLQLRHKQFRISPLEHDAWIQAMRTAVDDAGLSPADAFKILNHLEGMAETLVNTPW